MIEWYDVLVVAASALAAGVVGACLGALVLWKLRGRSFQVALTVVALTSVAVMAAAVIAVGALMLVSGHALAVLVSAVVAGAFAGLAVATVLGRSSARGGAALVAAARRLGEGEDPAARSPWTTTAAELTALAGELDRAHRRLSDARDRERQLESSRRELVAWVSHDLRTPLAGLRAMGEALEDGVVADPETVHEYHRRIRVESDRLADMIDDLFELSRINAGSMRLTLERVDLGAMVAATVAATAPLAQSKGVMLVAETTGGCGSALADQAALDRALRNLVINGIRHTPHDGTVTVAASTDGVGTMLTVRDECGGIPDHDLDRVFEVGFRGSSARTPGDGCGAGLGLAIAQGIVTAHNGSVDVRNVPGGCSFVVRLPVADARPVGVG